MAHFSRAADGRFVSKSSDLLVEQKAGLLKGNYAIIEAIGRSTSGDISKLMQGLAEERRLDDTLNVTWDMAEKIYREEVVKNPIYRQQGADPELHIALIAYVLKFFYAKFNEATRTLRSVAEVKNYPYKNFFKLLLLAVVKVNGQPGALPGNTKLYRGLTGHVNAVEKSEIAFQHFASTSRSKDIALGYAGVGKRTLLIIEDIMKSGVDAAKMLGTNACPNAICLDHIAPHNQ